MPDIHSESVFVKRNVTAPDNAAHDVIWGCGPIGAEIGLTAREANHLLSKGLIKSARKVGGRYQSTRSGLRREFGVSE